MFDFLNSHPILNKLFAIIFKIFKNETRPTRLNLFLLMLSFFTLNCCRSVRFQFLHSILFIFKKSLTSFYYTLKGAKINLDDWATELIKLALSIIPKDSKYPIYLSIDDTLVEKLGLHFEGVTDLHDHAKHNGTNYLHGHCFVCIMMYIPVFFDGILRYCSFPLAYRLWLPEKIAAEEYKSKLKIAAEQCESFLSHIGDEMKTIMLADCWYPKGEVLDLIKNHENVEGIFGVRIDTVMYDHPVKVEGAKGRPPLKGKKLNVNEDFNFVKVPGTEFNIAYKRVLTNLFGLQKEVLAVVTENVKSGSKRLFICTNPDMPSIEISCLTDKRYKAIAENFKDLLGFCAYSFRWAVETNFQLQKSFWGLNTYMVRSKTGIERVINLQSLTYALLSLLPHIDSEFKGLADRSIQERRFAIGKLIDRQIFLVGLVAECENDANSEDIAESCAKIARSKKYFSNLTGS